MIAGGHMNKVRVILSLASALVAFSVAVNVASANRLSISNKNFRATWSALRLNPGEIICKVTLEGSFHSATLAKVVNSLIGHVSRAAITNACTNGEASVLQEQLPWHIQYGGFEGTLPNITGVRYNLIGAAIRVRLNLFGINCVIKSSQATPDSGIAGIVSGSITNLRADETRSVPLVNECAGLGNSSFAGTGRLTVLSATTAITIRLI